jgi:hypothetical protein
VDHDKKISIGLIAVSVILVVIIFGPVGIISLVVLAAVGLLAFIAIRLDGIYKILKNFDFEAQDLNIRE